MYTSLNNAVIHDARLGRGDYKIYYLDGYHFDRSDDDFCNKIIRHIKCLGISADLEDALSKEIYKNTVLNNLYHTYVGSIRGDDDLEEIFKLMQGFVWSPNGEARTIIEALRLDHTSMCVGDLIETPDGDLYVVSNFGFEKLN